MAILTLDPLRPGVSVELSCSYLRAARIGARVDITARVLKIGKQLAFVEVMLESEGKAVASGKHTKAL